MTTNTFLERERTTIEKWSKFQLPNQWKKVGMFLGFGLLFIIFVLKFSDVEIGWFREVIQKRYINRPAHSEPL